MDVVEEDRNNLVEKMKIIENQRDDLLRKGRLVESERNDFLRNNKLMEMQKDDLENRCAMLQKTNATLNTRVRVSPILGEGTFFLGGGEGWAILGFFSQKSVGPPLHFNENTPDPPPTFR